MHLIRFINRRAPHLVCVTTTAILAGRLQAQSSPTPSAATLNRYDLNHNGRIDPDEQAAMDADQAKATPVTNQPGTSDTTVTLNPLEVDAGNDNRYYASNTTAGTCINSKVDDMGATIIA